MKLKRRLVMFNAANLVAFGIAFAIAYGSFHYTVLPMFDGLLQEKTERMARLLSAQLDVAIGADDHSMMTAAIDPVVADPDFSYLKVRDAHGETILARGTGEAALAFAGEPHVPLHDANAIAVWSPVRLETLDVGSVAVVFSTARLDRLDSLARRIAITVAAFLVFALIYSLAFARAFVSPLFAMMEFSRKVAGGQLAERLTTEAPGELAELRDYLNQMTAELERREQERLAAAEKAEEMQRELLEVSRMAGMAEIATGVLHNIGNVLNSLNVSVSLVDHRVRSSRAAALTRSVELFTKFPGGLPAFLATDKGKVFPDYLTGVSKLLVDENGEMLTELASIARNVDHIKTIVATQQTYARPGSGVGRERVHVPELIDDALRMGESSFARRGIEIHKHYGDGAVVTTDRHKLLQILINLVSNARQAMTEHGGAASALGVRVEVVDRQVQIAISDNGIGIPPENLAKIFMHGFTTKVGGHGFGLHASANAARELGGRLQVTSAGPGLGATFTLELPAERSTGVFHVVS